MSLRHAKEAFRDVQGRLDHNREPDLYDLALGMRLMAEGLEEEFGALKDRIAELASKLPP